MSVDVFYLGGRSRLCASSSISLAAVSSESSPRKRSATRRQRFFDWSLITRLGAASTIRRK